MTILEHEPLAPRTTFMVGGSARYFIEVATPEEIGEAFLFAEQKKLPVVVIGGGANILADDGEAEGVFIAPRFNDLSFTEGNNIVEVNAGASVSWDALVDESVKRGLWGLENLSAIPGSIGGAIVQNIGAYGAALSQHLSFVDVFDRQAMLVRRITKAECGFGYRISMFKKNPNRLVILGVQFELSHEGSANTAYRDLRERFTDTAPSLQEVREAVVAIRAGKFPDLSREGTAGSFFRNPSVERVQADALIARFPGLPVFPVPETDEIKIPVAWLLDHALGLRGYRRGTVRLFEKQALALVADRGASARDVRNLALEVKEKVFALVNIELEPEVVIMHGAQMGNTL